MNPDMPLEVIRPGVFVLSVRAEGAHITGRIVHQPVTNHLVLSLESFATFSTGTAFNWAIMRPYGRVDVGMRIQEILSLEGGCLAAFEFAFKTSTSQRARMASLASRGCSRSLLFRDRTGHRSAGAWSLWGGLVGGSILEIRRYRLASSIRTDSLLRISLSEQVRTVWSSRLDQCLQSLIAFWGGTRGGILDGGIMRLMMRIEASAGIDIHIMLSLLRT